MEFYVDIADIDTVRAVNEVFPIDGFTTNPNLLAKAERPLAELFEDYRAYIRHTGQRLFVQVTARDSAAMVEQAARLRNFFGEKLVVKLLGNGVKELKESANKDAFGISEHYLIQLKDAIIKSVYSG
jgi:fructose-6-phosphate aldolase 2